MDEEYRRRNANEALQQGYKEQVAGNTEEAIRLYRASLEYLPTPEAHALLGWSYSFQAKYDEAIDECKKAIALDPAYGNPYNDIGSYLIEKGDLDAAIPWLERALKAPRYDARHYPHFNLGRIYRAQGLLIRAVEEFEKSLAIKPDYDLARTQADETRGMLN